MTDVPQQIHLTDEERERIVLAVERKYEIDTRYRELDHSVWCEKQEKEGKTYFWNVLANRTVVVVNTFYFLLLCLLLYKFGGLS